MITYVGAPVPAARTAAAVADAHTRLAAKRWSASVAASTPCVPADVRWTRVLPATSARATMTGELERSKPGGRHPCSSPITSTSPSSSRSAIASSTPPTSQISLAPAAKAYAAVVNARRTSMATTVPPTPASSHRAT